METIRCPCCNVCLFCYFTKGEKRARNTVYIEQNVSRYRTEYFWRCENCEAEERTRGFKDDSVGTEPVGSGQEWL